MRAIGIAALVLVVIGAVEALESTRQIAESIGPLRVTPAGVGLSGIGLVASCVVYLTVGWRVGRDADALRDGAIVGLVAGLVGGAVRMTLIADVLRDAIRRYGAVPEWFLPVTAIAFVVGAIGVSAVAGAALAFLGVRLRNAIRSGRRRPPA